MPTAKATTREITAPQIVAQLETLAKPNYKRILLTHGIEEPDRVAHFAPEGAGGQSRHATRYCTRHADEGGP
ncbi:MAG: hypothetical protein MUF06_15615, partial [Pirellulaceae bacterium]|nr:hypothetical protein [Pirellulaceae bacterium]